MYQKECQGWAVPNLSQKEIVTINHGTCHAVDKIWLCTEECQGSALQQICTEKTCQGSTLQKICTEKVCQGSVLHHMPMVQRRNKKRTLQRYNLQKNGRRAPHGAHIRRV